MNATNTFQMLFSVHARGVGHTRAAISVAQQTNALLIVGSVKHKEQIIAEYKPQGWRVIALSEIEHNPAFSARPILIDHDAMMYLLSKVLSEIQKAQDDRREAVLELGKAKDVLRSIDKEFGCQHTDKGGSDEWSNLSRHVTELADAVRFTLDMHRAAPVSLQSYNKLKAALPK